MKAEIDNEIVRHEPGSKNHDQSMQEGKGNADNIAKDKTLLLDSEGKLNSDDSSLATGNVDGNPSKDDYNR